MTVMRDIQSEKRSVIERMKITTNKRTHTHGNHDIEMSKQEKESNSVEPKKTTQRMFIIFDK